MSRLETPPAFQLLHGSGAPRAGSGLDPYNGVNDPWRWLPAQNAWFSQAFDVSWGAGATIAPFASPTAGMLAIFIDPNNGASPLDAAGSAGNINTSTQVADAPGAGNVARSPSPEVTIPAAGDGVAFLVWDMFAEAQYAPANGYVADLTDVLPAESRTIADLLGADFTVSAGRDWDEVAVGNLGDWYIDDTTLSTTVDLYGPRAQYTWGGQPVARLGNVLVSPDGTAYRLKVADNGTLSTEAI